jgi:hypothetical protein
MIRIVINAFTPFKFRCKIGTLLSLISEGDIKTHSTTRGSTLLFLYCLQPILEKNGGPL